jgi:PAS domain S-box-containing protein
MTQPAPFSQESIRLIADIALDALIVVDASGAISAWNRQAEVTFGWQQAEAVGRPLAELIIPERYREAHRRGFERYKATLKPRMLDRRVELTALHRDGHELPVELAIAPTMTDGVLVFLGFVRDITDRKRSEQHLLESEQHFRHLADDAALSQARYQTLAESLPHLVWTCLPDGWCDYLSRQWCEYTGVPESQQVGYGWAKHVHPDDRERVQQAWSNATARGAPYDIEFRIRRADGVFRWFKTRAVPLEDGHGQIVKWFGSNTDFEAYKQAETHLQMQLERLGLLDRITRAIGARQDLHSVFEVVLSSLEESLPIDFGCVCMGDASAAALTVAAVGAQSASLAAAVGLAEQMPVAVDSEGVLRCLGGLVAYEPDSRQLEHAIYRRLSEGGFYSVVLAPLLVESRVFGVLIAARRNAHAFGSADCEFLRQVSEHAGLAAHQAELYQVLQRAYDDLRLSRDAALQHERLRALGQMAGGIAHNINNAISPVSIYTDWLLENEPNLSERSRDFLATIQRAIRDVAQTVSGMREFYREHKSELVLSRVDLNEIVQHALDLTRARWRDMAHQRGNALELELDLDPSQPIVWGLAGEIREALINLVFNAVDAMPDGGHLTVRTYCSNGVGAFSSVYLEVKDDGIGMDDDLRRRCIEPFVTTKGERGTGLGLAMVYGVIQRHGATLQIESAPAAGTTVRIAFSQAPARDSTIPEAALDPAPVPPLRILVIDDDPLLIKSLRDTLSHDGHQIVTAESGRDGIQAFESARLGVEPFAVVITDLGMPHLDGHKVAHAVKAASPNTPVVLLTGWGQRLIGGDDELPDIDYVLSKPPKLGELRAALSRVQRASAPS